MGEGGSPDSDHLLPMVLKTAQWSPPLEPPGSQPSTGISSHWASMRVSMNCQLDRI